MSAVGKMLWLEMQDKGPFSRSGFARLLKREYDFPTTHQSVSNYLRRPHPPAEFVGVAIRALRDRGLSDTKERQIYNVYFGHESAEEVPPNEPGLTQKNRDRTDQVRREKKERDQKIHEGENTDEPGDRAS